MLKNRTRNLSTDMLICLNIVVYINIYLNVSTNDLMIQIYLYMILGHIRQKEVETITCAVSLLLILFDFGTFLQKKLPLDSECLHSAHRKYIKETDTV